MRTKKPLEYYLRQADIFLIKRWKLYKNVINDLTEEEQEQFINCEIEQEQEKLKLINIIKQ